MHGLIPFHINLLDNFALDKTTFEIFESMTKSEIENLFSSFSTKKIAVIGDIMIDSYLWGKAERISPEAPVPVVMVENRESRPGGAANVAINIKSMGATPIMIALVGDDHRGKEFQEILNQLDIPSDGIKVDATRKTTVKHRIIASNQHLVRVDEELTTPISGDTERRFIDHCIKVLTSHKPDAIIFEDYDKGNITPAVIEAVVHFAQQHQIPTMVDPKKRNFLHYKNVTLFKPNFKELVEGAKIDHLSKNKPEEINKAAIELQKRLGAQYLMVTLSEHGVLITDGNRYFHMPAQKREIADVSGAGDTVISVASLLLCSGVPMENLATISNIAGGLVCEKPGVVLIDREQLFEETLNYFLS